MEASSDRIATLDGIRGIAAVAVMVFHVGLRLRLPWLAGHGALAVDVFFCMSGVVIERAYGERLRAGWPSAAFVRARWRRLYPLYGLGLVLGLSARVLTPLWHGQPLPADLLGIAVVLGTLLVPLIGPGAAQVFPLNPPAWSLFVEAVANAGFAIAPRRIPLAVLAMGGAAVVAGAAAARMPLIEGGRSDLVWIDLARGALGFGVGSLIGGFSRRPGFARVPRPPAALILTLLVGLLLVPRGPLDAWFDPAAILLLVPALVALAVASRPAPALGRWCVWAGDLSYPLYVVHAPLVDAAARLVPDEPSLWGARAVALAAAGVAALLTAAALARLGAVNGIPRMRLQGDEASRRQTPPPRVPAAIPLP